MWDDFGSWFCIVLLLGYMKMVYDNMSGKKDLVSCNLNYILWNID